MKKNVLKVMLGSVIGEAILVCLFILIGSFDSVAMKSMGAVAIIFTFSVPCLFYAGIYDNNKYKNVAITGAILAGITALICILGVLEIIEWSKVLIKSVSIFTVAIWALALISWVLSYNSINNLLRIFKRASIFLTTIFSIFVILIILAEEFPDGFLARLFYVILVLLSGSNICMRILIRTYRKEINENNDEINNFDDNTQMKSNFMQVQNQNPNQNLNPNISLNNYISQANINTQPNQNQNNNSNINN